MRLDAGYGAGQTVPQAFDSLIAKLIVTGASRTQALERSRRALAEFDVGGMPTVLPFHRAVVDDPAFAGRQLQRAHPLDRDRVRPPMLEPQPAAATEPDPARERLTVEVGGKRLEVVVPAVLSVGRGGPRFGRGVQERPARLPPRRPRPGPRRGRRRPGHARCRARS